MIPESDRVMGQIVVDAGFLSADQLHMYLTDVEAGRKSPGSLVPLLRQSGRIQESDIPVLRQRWQARQAGASGPHAAPASAPQDSNANALQLLVSAGILDEGRAQQVRSQLANWRSQGTAVSVRDAVIHLRLASPQQVDQVLQRAPSGRNGMVAAPAEDPGKRTEVLTFNPLGPQPGSDFMTPVPQGSPFASQVGSMSSQGGSLSGPMNGQMNGPLSR